jgi:hypothetical protein
MSDVHIRDLTAILGSATDLVTAGTSLETDMAGLVDEISNREASQPWGQDDEFARNFLDQGEGGYHHPGADGTVAAEVVKGLGKSLGADSPSLGGIAQNHGNFVVTAMLNSSDTDTGNGASIGSIQI